jgi:hypothetical protein
MIQAPMGWQFPGRPSVHMVGLVHLVGIGDSVAAGPANRVAFTTVAAKTGGAT